MGEFKKEALDALGVYRRNMSHIVGKNDEAVKAIETCIRLVDEIEDKQQWIPLTSRPMDDEEREYYSEKYGYDLSDDEAVIYDCALPDDGEEVLVSTRYGHVYIDTFCEDEGCYFEDNGDMDGIVAWQRKPEPYKGEAK